SETARWEECDETTSESRTTALRTDLSDREDSRDACPRSHGAARPTELRPSQENHEHIGRRDVGQDLHALPPSARATLRRRLEAGARGRLEAAGASTRRRFGCDSLDVQRDAAGDLTDIRTARDFKDPSS